MPRHNFFNCIALISRSQKKTNKQTNDIITIQCSRFIYFSGLKCTSAIKTRRSDNNNYNNNNNNNYNYNNNNNNNNNSCRPFCTQPFRREVIYSPSGNSLQIWEHPPLPASHKLTLQPIPSSLPSGQSTLPSQNFLTSTQSVEFTHDLSLDLQVTPAVAEINKTGVQSISQSIKRPFNPIRVTTELQGAVTKHILKFDSHKIIKSFAFASRGIVQL